MGGKCFQWVFGQKEKIKKIGEARVFSFQVHQNVWTKTPMYYNMLGFLLFMVSNFFFFFFLSFASFPFCHFQLHVNCFIYLFIYFKFPSLVFCPFFFLLQFFCPFLCISLGWFFFCFIFFFFLVHSCECIYIYIYIFQICYFFIYQGFESKFIQTKFSIPPLFYF